MNIPTRAGQKYRCFTLRRAGGEACGSYGANTRSALWVCDECGYRLSTAPAFDGSPPVPALMARLADHHERGHAPCAYCGKLLLRRKDGSPRQHNYNHCPEKNPGLKTERECI